MVIWMGRRGGRKYGWGKDYEWYVRDMAYFFKWGERKTFRIGGLYNPYQIRTNNNLSRYKLTYVPF